MDGVLQWLDTLTFWHWMVVGAALIVVELLAPGIWFLWLGIGAVATGLVVMVFSGITWQIQAVIYSGLSVLSVVIGRMIMRRTKQTDDHPTLNRRVQQYIGQTYALEKDTSHGYGDVRIGDSVWRVQLVDTSQQLTAGAMVRVTGVDGATLKVELASD